jgi:diguanylate cyclase (GGDEF)-like protein
MVNPPSISDACLAELHDLNRQAEARLGANPNETVQIALRAYEAARAANVRETQPKSLFLRGTALVLLEQTDQGEALLVEALNGAEALGQSELQFRCVNGLGTVAHTRGEYGKAFSHYHRYLAYARGAGDRLAEVRALGNIGLLYFEMGELERSLEIGKEVLSIAETLGSPLVSVVCATNLAEAQVLGGDFERALETVRVWRPIAQEHGFHVQEALLQGSDGAAKLGLGRAADALADLESAVERGRHLGNLVDLCGPLISLGECYIALGRTDEADAALCEAHRRCEAARSIALQLKASRVLMTLYESQARHKEALEHARSVLQFQEHIHSERLSRRTEVLAVEFEIDQLRNQAELERQKTEVLQESNALLQRLQENLQHEVTHDPLTGLYNRRHFLELLEQTLIECRENKRRFGIAYLDLDAFKPINDNHGHTAGDALLVEIARRLADATRAGDVLARLGGDEFAVIVKDIKEAKDAERKAQRLSQALKNAFLWNGLTLQCSVSVGVATFPEHGLTATELLHQADSAMYKHKRRRMQQR